jgi:hypothetical protein
MSELEEETNNKPAAMSQGKVFLTVALISLVAGMAGGLYGALKWQADYMAL